MEMKRLKLCAFAMMVLMLGLGSSVRAATLENGSVRIEIDDQARVVGIVDKHNPGFNLIGSHPEGFWRLNLQKGTSLENMVGSQNQRYRVTTDGKAIVVEVPSVRMRGQELPIALTFRVTLKGDEIHWSAKVANTSDYTVAEVYMPEIAGLVGLGDANRKDDLYWPEVLGRKIPDFKSTLHPEQDSLANLSVAVNRLQDPSIELTYPSGASMAWTTLNNGRRGLYFAAHDPGALTGAMRAGAHASSGNDLFFSYVKYPFIAPGQTWASADYVVSPYEGDWHVAADKYRAFLQTWRQVRSKPEWVRNTQGMFLVILRQQYGDVMWHYQDLPFLYDQAKKSGLDTVGLFGWTQAGHDNLYPEVHADPEMGGDEGLKAGLSEIAKTGGHSILYLQGALIDPTSKEYPDATAKYAAKNIWGTPYYEFYPKASESSFLHNFSRKAFSPACPGAPGWADLMKSNGKKAMAFNPTGIIYDQIGGMPPYPCFHTGLEGSPSAIFVNGRRSLLDALGTNLHSIRPDAGFMVEHATDVFSQYVDIVHCARFACFYAPQAFPELFRYTVPDVIVTARHPALRPEKAQVNYAFTYGLRFELEIRYRDEIPILRENIHPEMAEYLRRLTQVRARHWNLLGLGRLLNSSLVSSQNGAVRYTLFGDGDSRAVVAWNPSAAAQDARFTLPGYSVQQVDGVNGPGEGSASPLGPNEVRVWIMQPAARAQ
jgi:hypothetical protein